MAYPDRKIAGAVMQYGYSLTLHELLDAAEVEIGDCTPFQITCPSCREAVFKKTRSRPHGGITHFLSHYRADEEEAKECELRVAAIGQSQLLPFNAAARGQTLSGFLHVLGAAIFEAEEPVFEAGTFKPAVYRVLSRDVFDEMFVGPARAALGAVLQLPDPRIMVAEMIGGFPKFQDRSPFWNRRQASFVLEVAAHLLNAQSRQNLRILAAAACVHIAFQADDYRNRQRALRVPGIGYDPLPAVEVLVALVGGKSKQAVKKTAARFSGADKMNSPSGAAAKMQIVTNGLTCEMIGPIVGILASIDFPGLAGNQGTQRTRMPVMESMLKELMSLLSTKPTVQPGPD